MRSTLLPHHRLQALASVVWSLHRLDLRPLPDWLRLCMRAARIKLPGIEPRDLALLLQVCRASDYLAPVQWVPHVAAV